MVISLCGNNDDKQILINKLKIIYKDKVTVCDYYQLYLSTCVRHKRKYMALEKAYGSEVANKKFENHINKAISRRMKEIFNITDKIIILISDSVLYNDINKTEYFNSSDLKILVTSEEGLGTSDSLYNNRDFDIVLDINDSFNVKKVVKF